MSKDSVLAMCSRPDLNYWHKDWAYPYVGMSVKFSVAVGSGVPICVKVPAVTGQLLQHVVLLRDGSSPQEL